MIFPSRSDVPAARAAPSSWFLLFAGTHHSASSMSESGLYLARFPFSLILLALLNVLSIHDIRHGLSNG